MRIHVGTMNVPTAGTRVQLSSHTGIKATDRVLWLHFSPREDNTGEIFVGMSDVSSTQGFELDPGGANKQKDKLIMDFRGVGGSVPAGDIWFDADTNANKVDFALIFED